MGVCGVMIVWIIAIYIPSAMLPAQSRQRWRWAGCVACLGFAVFIPKRLHLFCSCAFIVYFGLVSDLAFVVPLLTLGRQLATMLRFYFYFFNSLFIVYAIIYQKFHLRILTGKKHRQIKLHMGVWAVGTLNQLFIRGS